MMGMLMCQLGWALGVSTRVLLDQMHGKGGGLKRADCPPSCGRASASPLKARAGHKGQSLPARANSPVGEMAFGASSALSTLLGLQPSGPHFRFAPASLSHMNQSLMPTWSTYYVPVMLKGYGGTTVKKTKPSSVNDMTRWY